MSAVRVRKCFEQLRPASRAEVIRTWFELDAQKGEERIKLQLLERSGVFVVTALAEAGKSYRAVAHTAPTFANAVETFKRVHREFA